MPTINWNVSPILVTIPKGPIVWVLGVVGLIVFLNGLRRKASDLQTLGAMMVGAAALIWKFLGDGFGLRYYSLIFVAVFLGGYALFNWQVKRGGGSEEEAADFIVYGVLGVLIGARLGHVIFYDYAKALRDPVWVLKIWTGGLSSHGAVLGLIVAMWLFTVRRGVSFLEGSDRFAFSAALGAALVRLGNLFNSEIIGRPTDQSWGIRLVQIDGPDGPLRYPTQLYEFALGLAVLGLLLLIDRLAGREKRPRGLLISSFFVLYFTGRFFVEFYKDYQEGIASPESPLSMGQWLSIPGVLLGVYGVWWSLRRKIPVAWPATANDEDEEDTDGDEDEDEDEDESEDAGSEEEDEDEDGADAEPPQDAEDGDETDEEHKAERDRAPRKKRKKRKTKPQSTSQRAAKASPSVDPDVEEEFGPDANKRRRAHEGDLEEEKE